MRRFPDGLLDTVCTGHDGFGGDGSFDTSGGYLDADVILAEAFDGPTVLLTADGLTVIDVVDYPGDAVSQEPRPCGHGAWTTCDTQSGRLQLWRLADRH